MSELSSIISKIGSFLSTFTHSDPSIQQSVNNVGQTLNDAATQVESIVPHLVDDAVNAALAYVPAGLGTDAAPAVDALINDIIAGLETKLTKNQAAPPVAAPTSAS